MSSDSHIAPLNKILSPRRKSSSPRTPSGYTSEDDASVHPASDALWHEFVSNLSQFVDLYMQHKPTCDIVAVLHRQIGAFKSIERSIHGALFMQFFTLDESACEQRAFYVGCIHQLISPHALYRVRCSAVDELPACLLLGYSQPEIDSDCRSRDFASLKS